MFVLNEKLFLNTLIFPFQMMKKKIPLLFFFLLCCYLPNAKANAQTPKQQIDSVKSILQKTKDLRKQTVLLNQLSRMESEQNEFQSGLSYAQKANKIAIHEKDIHGRSIALLNMAISERNLGNYPSAINNLEQSLELAKKNSDQLTQAEVYENLGHTYSSKLETEKAMEFHQKALKMHRELKDKVLVAISCSNIAEIFQTQNNYFQSIKYYEEALSIFKNYDDNWRIAFTAAKLGQQYSSLSKNPEALKNFYTALEYYKKSNNLEGVSWCYMLIGNIYVLTDDNKIGLEYFKKSLKISEKLGRNDDINNAYTSIGGYYHKKNPPEYELALQYYNKVLDLAKKEKDSELFWQSMINNLIGQTKIKQNKFDEALFHLKLSVQTSTKISNNLGIYGSKRHMAFAYYEKKNYPEAKKYIEESIGYHLKTKEKNPLFDDYRLLSLIEEKMGNYKAALGHEKLYKIYHDSIKLDDASKKVMKYEFDQKETETKIKQQEELRQKSVVANTTYGILGAVILLTGLGLYTYWIRNKKLILEKQNLDLKRREAELAKETEEFKTRFMSNISHEFRTPLTLINGHLEILKKEGDAKNLKRFNEMEYSGQRLLQLINQLLDLTKIETGKYSLYYKKGNLLNEAQNYVQAFHSLAQQREIQLLVVISDVAKEELAKKDFAYSSEALASIFNNLLSNALKFTLKGGKIVCTIDFIVGKLYISVRDSGSGIPAKDLPHIFERFYQVQQNDMPIYEGSGIGLAIVKELSQFHGGDALVENNADQGCTFTVWLAEGNSISHEGNNVAIKSDFIEYPEEISEEENAAQEDKTLVLVVEDQRELRKFIVENLGSQYRFIEATNGKEGVDLAQKHLPEIIISDVMMPEKNGFQLTQILKESEITSHIPIILLTAKSELDDKIEGLENGADDYLTKPFSISELELRVKNRLRQQEILRKKFAGNSLPPNKENAPELNLLDRNFIEKLNSIVIKHIEDEIDVTLLASEIGLSNSQLTRKLKVLAGITPANFIKNIQLYFALELLRDGYTVSEAAWKSGFTEPAYFSKVFKKHFGFLPSEKERF